MQLPPLPPHTQKPLSPPHSLLVPSSAPASHPPSQLLTAGSCLPPSAHHHLALLPPLLLSLKPPCLYHPPTTHPSTTIPRFRTTPAGLPEYLSQAKQSLARGYSVLALQSGEEGSGCFSSSVRNGYQDDRPRVSA